MTVAADAGFDLAEHHREKIRGLEQRVAALERHRETLERILGLALRVAVGESGVGELTLLGVLEELDDAGVTAGTLREALDPERLSGARCEPRACRR